MTELGFALIALGLVAALALGPHIRHGGFYSDDWANAADSLYPPAGSGLGNALSYFADLTIYRPVLVLYVPLTYVVFGTHMHIHLAWSAALAVLATTMFYGTLRILGVPWIHALLIGALAIVFPWSDSLRLWITADQITLSITFVWAGLMVALVGLNRGSLRWHVVAAALYVLSIFCYEVTLPLIACFGFLYWIRAGWRAARLRWLMDLAVVVATGVWVASHTTRAASGVSSDITHLRQIVTWGGTLLGRAGLPLGPSQTTWVLCAIAAVVVAGAIAYALLPARFAAPSRWGLRGWLLLAAAGLAIAALGWAMFIPADPYYTPSVYGVTNRVNGLAAFGLILVVYAAFGIIGTLIAQLRPRAGWMAPTVTALLALAMLASYTHVLRRHISIWDSAFVAETSAMQELRQQMPRLPHGTTVFTSSYPANQTLGVPIFGDNWGLNGLIKIEYDDGTLSAYPMLAGMRIGCRAGGVRLEGEGALEFTAPYGRARLLDLQTGGHSIPRSRGQCKRAAHRYVPGPLYLSDAY